MNPLPTGLTEEIVNDLELGKKVIVMLSKKICRISLKEGRVLMEELSPKDDDAKEWRRRLGWSEALFK